MPEDRPPGRGWATSRDHATHRHLLSALSRPDILSEVNALESIGEASFEAIWRSVAAVLSEPVVSKTAPSSFALHAPLELLARSTLYRFAPSEDFVSKMRLVSIAARHAAELRGTPSTHESVDCAARLNIVDAINAGDPDGADQAVVRETDPWRLRAALAAAGVERTAAAGHSNIWVHLFEPLTTPNLPMVRGLARALASEPQQRIATDIAAPAATLAEALGGLAHTGPPAGRGIAALVAHVLDADPDGMSTLASTVVSQGEQGNNDLLRFAAGQMILGSDEFTPYGWTHALTLAQAAFAAAAFVEEPSRARRVASVYAAAFWSGYGDPTVSPVHAFERKAPAGSWLPLIRAALRSDDAHVAKYTLSCLQCAQRDPEAAGLYFEAARRLRQWWDRHPPVDDPLAAVLHRTAEA